MDETIALPGPTAAGEDLWIAGTDAGAVVSYQRSAGSQCPESEEELVFVALGDEGITAEQVVSCEPEWTSPLVALDDGTVGIIVAESLSPEPGLPETPLEVTLLRFSLSYQTLERVPLALDPSLPEMTTLVVGKDVLLAYQHPALHTIDPVSGLVRSELGDAFGAGDYRHLLDARASGSVFAIVRKREKLLEVGYLDCEGVLQGEWLSIAEDFDDD